MNARLNGVVILLLAAETGCQRYVAPPESFVEGNVEALRASLGGGTGTAAAAVTAVEPVGFATITGKFTLGGAILSRKTLTVDKDQSVCAPGGKQVFGEDLVVDPATKGIKDVVIFLTSKEFKPGDPKWEHPTYTATQAAQVEFDQKNCVFLSHMFAMRATQTAKVLNSDPVGHNTNIAGGGKAKPDNISVGANSYTTYAPGGESPEPFSVACSIHPWMSARMLVRNSPYFAVTKPDGSFEIANVPAGVDLEFRVWQEKANYLQQVTVNGTAQKWPKGRLKIKLADGQPQNLDVVVDASIFAK